MLDRPDVSATANPADATWTLVLGDRAHTVREWTWGERWRLIDAATSGQELRREAFVDGLLELLVTPEVAGPDRTVAAAATLRLLGVEPGDRPRPLLESEATLGRTWGLGPAELDGQPARRLDQHLNHVEPAPATAATAAPDGRRSIVIVDD